MKKCVECKKLIRENKELQETIEVLRNVIHTHINQKYPEIFSPYEVKEKNESSQKNI